MGFRIKFSNQAAQDFSDIVEYISDKLYSPTAAERFYQETGKRLGKISENPFIYPVSRIDRLSADGYHVAVIGNYLMFYLINEADSIAYIVRIVYGKRDISAIFK